MVFAMGVVVFVMVVVVKMFAKRINYVRLYVSRRASGVSVAGFCSAVIRSHAAAAAAATISVVAAVGIRKSVGNQSTKSLFLVAIVVTIQHLKFL